MLKKLFKKFIFAVLIFSISPSFSQTQINEKPVSATVVLTPENEPAPTPALTDVVDFLELRNTFAKRIDFNTRCESSRPTVAWVKATEAKDFKLAYEIILKWFDKCPVDARAHLWAIGALKELGNQPEKIEAHKKWWFGLTDSMIKSGDGKTPQTAFVVISISEQNAVLMRFGLKKLKQQLLPGPVDLLTVSAMDGSGPEMPIHFNVNWNFMRYEKMFDVKK